MKKHHCRPSKVPTRKQSEKCEEKLDAVMDKIATKKGYNTADKKDHARQHDPAYKRAFDNLAELVNAAEDVVYPRNTDDDPMPGGGTHSRRTTYRRAPSKAVKYGRLTRRR